MLVPYESPMLEVIHLDSAPGALDVGSLGATMTVEDTREDY